MPFKFHASRHRKIPKARYAVENWPAYESSLRQRGDLRIWVGEDVAAHWTVPGKRTPKGYPIDTDLAIETVLTLRLVFHQPLRQTEGLIGSIFDLSVPDHSTLSRRGRSLERLRRVPSSKDSLDLVVDSTGLKVYGPGEWQRERFGERKMGQPRSAWKKLHLGIDPDDGEMATQGVDHLCPLSNKLLACSKQHGQRLALG